jgi:hypothetical protein
MKRLSTISRRSEIGAQREKIKPSSSFYNEIETEVKSTRVQITASYSWLRLAIKKKEKKEQPGCIKSKGPSAPKSDKSSRF